MSTTRIAVLYAAILITGCATERWVQEGKTDEDVAAALARCEQSMPPQPISPTGPPYNLPDPSFVRKCMSDQGYQFVRNK